MTARERLTEALYLRRLWGHRDANPGAILAFLLDDPEGRALAIEALEEIEA